MAYLSIAIVSFAISISVVPILQKIAWRWGIVDKPNQPHKSHAEPIPYLGGIAIAVPVALLGAAVSASNYLSQEVIIRGALLLIPGLILLIIGLIDDIMNLSASIRLLVQLPTSTIVCIFLVTNEYAVQIVENRNLNLVISVFWLVGITNSLNLLDNLDGSAAGFSVIVSITLFVLSIKEGQTLIAAYVLSLGSASLGLLFWNGNPAKIYLGDSGALFLGLSFSVLLLQFEPSTSTLIGSLALPILLMAVPIMDTTVAVISRLKRKRSPFQGGRDHLSHRLQALGIDQRNSAIAIWSITATFCTLALILNLLSSSLEILFSIGGLLLLCISVIYFLGKPHL